MTILELDHVEVSVMNSSNNGAPDSDGVDDASTRLNLASGGILPRPLPSWVSKQCKEWGEILQVDEWKEDGGIYRNKHGWKGQDLIHDTNAAVRIIEYYVQYGTADPPSGLVRGGVDTTLTGVIHFTKRAESHSGYCHGGSMTSIMDDVIGWAAFLVTGQCRPWTGFTVQVNTSLKRPIPVDSILLVQARITNVERRKISVQATILDPDEQDDDATTNTMGHVVGTTPSVAIHATAEGLVVINRGVLPEGYNRTSSTMSTS